MGNKFEWSEWQLSGNLRSEVSDSLEYLKYILILLLFLAFSLVHYFKFQSILKRQEFLLWGAMLTCCMRRRHLKNAFWFCAIVLRNS